jgi:hypothetical protein
MTEADDSPKPWERMPGESDRAFSKFCAYRDLGPQRSLLKLRQMHVRDKGWTRPALEYLSNRWRWVARAAAWDNEQDRLRLEAQAKVTAEMAERQARDGLDMQKLARGAMAKWLKQDPETGQLTLGRELTPSETTRLYRLGFDVERLARGEPTQRTASQEEPPMTLDEMKRRAKEQMQALEVLARLGEDPDQGAAGDDD